MIRPPNERTDRTARGSRGAFTLAEVVMAVAIAASVMVALIALFPLALDSLTAAQTKAAHARIVQSLSGDYELKNWNLLLEEESSGSTPYGFDRTGTMVDLSDPERVYLASVSIKPMPPVPGADWSNRSLRAITIKVALKPEGESIGEDDKAATYQAVISRKDSGNA